MDFIDWRLVTLCIMAALYAVGGVNHFWHPATYLKIMPPYLPAHRLLNAVAGAAELVLAMGLLLPQTRPWAAWGVITLLIAVFPAHIYMLQRGGAAYGLPQWALIARMPAQALLMLWAWIYTY